MEILHFCNVFLFFITIKNGTILLDQIFLRVLKLRDEYIFGIYIEGGRKKLKKSISLIIILTIFAASLIFSAYAEAGEVPYVDASSWALPELDRAAEYGFITDKIKEKMKTSITREEFAELAVILYEKFTGVMAVSSDTSTFIDTINPEILKAYNLKIVNGTDRYRKLFSPEGFATREQVAVMLYRTIKEMNPGVDLSTEGIGTFPDEQDISDWALESLKFMNKNGFMLGGDGKISPQATCTREMAALIITRIYERYFTGSTENTADNGGPKVTDSDEANYLEQIIVNDIEIYADNYRVKGKNGFDYILISADKFKYAFKLSNAGYHTYPEVNIIGSSISVIWSNEEGIVMQVDMQEGSEVALLNGIKVDVGIAPYMQNGKMFIPINFFIAAGGMDTEASSKGDILYIQYEDDFPGSTLVGTWSDADIDLFAGLKEIEFRTVTAPSFATAYMFNGDGTYGMRMLSSGSGNDIFILQSGKYRIMGNTILLYDILETVYKGTPLALQYEAKILETPQYLFIYNYEPKMEKIEIGGFWMNKR